MSFVCAIPLIASLFSACGPEPPLAVGYVEGEYVLLAPIEIAHVKSVAVRRGDRVTPGMALAELDDADARIAVAQAAAALSQAEAQLADLRRGRRPEEIAVLDAALRSAVAESAEARRSLTRAERLFTDGVATEAQRDEAATQFDVAEARRREAEANLAVADLAARAHAIEAAEHQVEAAAATLDMARWRLSQRTLAAPSAGRIDDVVRRVGDLAGPAAPVFSMLPDGAVKLKVYVAEQQVSAVGVGTLLAVRCDGCDAGLQARVSYVSPDPEFTPPVIYSLENRQKLVYLVEARPEGEASRLQPGQIVDVQLAGDER
jgi:HlyD family secretion protein